MSDIIIVKKFDWKLSAYLKKRYGLSFGILVHFLDIPKRKDGFLSREELIPIGLVLIFIVSQSFWKSGVGDVIKSKVAAFLRIEKGSRILDQLATRNAVHMVCVGK